MRPAESGGHPDEHLVDEVGARRASIEHLQQAGVLPWTGVRNYQARNFMRDAMRMGDRVLFYHSSCAEPGIAGLAEVCSAPYPDPTQFDVRSPYFDAKSKPEAPRWLLVDVRFVAKTPLLSLSALRAAPELASMQILQRGNRLSITPVSEAEWRLLAPRLGPGMSLLLATQLLLLGIASGFLAGLLGIGGGMLMVPFLTAMLLAQGVAEPMAVKMAIATSMACIVATSSSSLRAHHRRGAVRWELVRAMAPGIVAGGLLSGAALFALLKGQWLGRRVRRVCRLLGAADVARQAAATRGAAFPVRRP